jgi:serine protease Do
VRYAYGITAALLLGGTVATLTLQQPALGQVAQNAPGRIAQAPTGAPMSFADLAAKLQPAVVNVSTTQKVKISQGGLPGFPGFPSGTPFDDLFKQFGGGDEGGAPVTREATSLGSGFIISPDGYIVTNNHVISGGAGEGDGTTPAAPVDSITVTLPDHREYKARLVGRDIPSDMALLKIEATNLPFVQWGDSTQARVGDWILAIGNPFALGGTVTAGIISALHRNVQAGQYDRYIQTDAAINQGNSGGPMFDLAGNVIGINTLIFSPTGGNVGIGFAIPAEQARPVIDALMKGGKVRRGYLGVGIQPVTDDIASSLGLPKNHGEIVARVEPGNAASRAGISQGDVIVRVNGQDVTPDNTLSYIVANLPIGARVPLELIRDGKRMTVTAVVGERPSEKQIAAASGLGGGDSDDSGVAAGQAQSGQEAARASLGLTLQAMTPAFAQQLGVPATTHGVVVTALDQSSDAAQQGINRGDIILSINQQPTPTAQAAAAAVEVARRAGRPTVLLLVQRGARPPTYVGVKIQGK